GGGLGRGCSSIPGGRGGLRPWRGSQPARRSGPHAARGSSARWRTPIPRAALRAGPPGARQPGSAAGPSGPCAGGRRSRRSPPAWPGTPPGHSLPGPLTEFGLVDPVLVGVALGVDLHVAQPLLGMGAGDLQARHAIDHVYREAEAVDLVLNGEIEWRVDVAPLLVAADVQVPVVGAPVGQP